ncbi:MAG: bifunctional pyr operon transcriptional regulator/uracil phosphoribosyltransferase PyrR [Polyangiales bacterium]
MTRHFNEVALGHLTERLAADIAAAAMPEAFALVGIRRGGVGLAACLGRMLAQHWGQPVPVGTVDTSLYRDDAAVRLPSPLSGPSVIRFPMGGLDVVLVDDVLHTGRTVRAAIDAVLDYGRPRRIRLAVLFDRGGRELPIAADFVGHTLSLTPRARLDVRLDADGHGAAEVQLPREEHAEGGA